MAPALLLAPKKNGSLHLLKMLSPLALVILLSAGLPLKSAQAAEKIIFTYGSFSQSLTLDELKTFAETGKASSRLRFFIRAAKQDPRNVQKILTKPLDFKLKALDRVFNFLPAEYALYELGRIIHTPSKQANVQALRSAVILAARDDNRLSLLEFVDRYPTRELYIDGLQLVKTKSRIETLIRNSKTSLTGPIAILKDLLCDCNKAQTSQEPAKD